MATLRSYVERMPMTYRHRYRSSYWVSWANALLERLSGAGYLPPQLLTRGVVVHNGVWVNRPPMSRDVKELRSAQDQSFVYRFAEENNRLRIFETVFSKPEKRVYPIVESSPSYIVLDNTEAKLDNGYLENWLFVATGGTAARHTFIVETNAESDDNHTVVTFRDRKGAGMDTDWDFSDPMPDDPPLDIDDEPFITTGYFVAPRDYLMLSFTAKFDPLLSMDDNLGIEGYENLVDAWFRWKVEEQVSALSQECAYWNQQFDIEMSRLRIERFNRVNKPQGRRLAGFAG